MTIDAALLAQGMSYEQFKDSMTRNRDVVETNERAVALDPGDVAFFKALPRPLTVIALAEDWCGDVIANLPVLARLAAATGKLKVHVFDKSKHPDLMKRWLNQGKFESIPVFALFDEGLRELGALIERPASVTTKRAEARLAIYASDPSFGSPEASVSDLPDETRERLMAAITKMRADQKPWADAEVVRALRVIARPAASA